MASVTISKFEDLNSTDSYDLKDNNAIRKIIFNGKECNVNNGTATITNHIEDIFKDKDVVALTIKDKKKIKDIDGSLNKKVTFEITTEENERKERTLFAVNEDNKYSLIAFKKENDVYSTVNLTKLDFEDTNIDFDYVTTRKVYNPSTFTSYKNLYKFLEEKNDSDKYINLSSTKISIEANSATDNSGYQAAYNSAGNIFIYDSIEHPSRDKYLIFIKYNDAPDSNSNNKIYCNLLLPSTTDKYKFGEIIINGENYFDPDNKKEDEAYLTNMNMLARRIADPRME